MWNLLFCRASPSKGHREQPNSSSSLIAILFCIGKTVIMSSLGLLFPLPLLIGHIFLNIFLFLLSFFNIFLIASVLLTAALKTGYSQYWIVVWLLSRVLHIIFLSTRNSKIFAFPYSFSIGKCSIWPSRFEYSLNSVIFFLSFLLQRGKGERVALGEDSPGIWGTSKVTQGKNLRIGRYRCKLWVQIPLKGMTCFDVPASVSPVHYHWCCTMYQCFEIRARSVLLVEHGW